MTVAAPTAHARYRTRLAALRDDEAILAAAREFAAGLRPLGRAYERFHPQRQPFATLVLRDARDPLLRVEAFDARPGGLGAVVASEAGWLRLSAVASDPALPALAVVLARPGRPRVVRYRPYRRCTVRFDRGYAKLFADRRGARLLDEGRRLWAVAERGRLSFAVPRPERCDDGGRTLWQSRVPGRPLGRLRDPGLARRMGRALSSLARSELRPSAVLTPAALIGRSARLGRGLVRTVPAARGELDELLARLRDAHAAAAPGRLVPVHGNPNAGQWLDGEAGLGLVDFDGLALAQPELDAAALLAALEFEDRARVPVERLRAAFLAGYAERGPALDPGLLAIHRAHRRIAKAARAASSLRLDGDARAVRHLKQALRELEREVV